MAGEAVARAEAKRLAEFLRSLGITVSVELQQGRGEWHVTKYLVMNHHTATYKPAPGGNLTPALGICKAGRPDVPGPLCNGYGGYDFVFRIITMGLANHPGAGGPITIDGVRVPQDSARPPTFGIEWEGGYHTWTATERKWMAQVNAALTRFYGRPNTSQLEHKTWAPTRKVDRKDFTRDVAITDSAQYATSTGEDSLSAAEVAELKKHMDEQLKRVVHFLTSGRPDTSLFTGPSAVAWMDDAETVTINEVMEKANLAAFFAKLAFDLANPNGFGHVMPRTGELVPQGTEGAVPASDFWRWARESVVADREDDDRHTAVVDAIDALAAAHQPPDA